VGKEEEVLMDQREFELELAESCSPEEATKIIDKYVWHTGTTWCPILVRNAIARSINDGRLVSWQQEKI